MGSITLNPPATPGRPVDLDVLTVREHVNVSEVRAAIVDAIEDARRRAYVAGPDGWAGLAAGIVTAWADALEADLPPRRMSRALAVDLATRAVALSRMAASLPAAEPRGWAA